MSVNKKLDVGLVRDAGSTSLPGIEVYLPDSCLQGQDLPGHIVWDQTAQPEITIVLPASVRIKALYNAKLSGVKRGRKQTVIGKFEVGGYLGLLFTTKVLTEKRVRVSLTFTVRFPNGKGSREITRKVDLFRPALKVGKAPSEIMVGYDAGSKTYSFSDKVRLINDGDGTAIILARPSNNEEFTQSIPAGTAEFGNAFVIDMEARSVAMKARWPHYETLIDDFMVVLKQPVSLEKSYRKHVTDLFENLAMKFREDHQFLEAFVTALAVSYLRNIQLLTEFTSFMEYLNSIGEGRILLTNSVEVLKPRNPQSRLHLRVDITDLANNDYAPLMVGPIRVSCPTNVEIPVHAIFEWSAKKE